METIQNPTHPPTPSRPGAAPGPNPVQDPRDVLRAALHRAAPLVEFCGTLRTDELDAPTPCDRWTLLDLVRHVVGVAQRIGAVGRHEPPMSVPEVPEVPAAELADAWAAAVGDAEAAWRGADRLGELCEVPWGSVPGVAAIGAYIGEITVHTWDLETATAHLDAAPTVAWDQDVAAATLVSLVEMFPADGRDAAMPFVDAVAVPASASAVEQLVGFCGRRPPFAVR